MRVYTQMGSCMGDLGLADLNLLVPPILESERRSHKRESAQHSVRNGHAFCSCGDLSSLTSQLPIAQRTGG